MLQRVITRIFRGRHYWRSVSFDEIAELYTSRLITIFALNIVNLFASVYLYKLGYSLVFIALFYAITYAIKIPFSVIAAKYAAYFGPKHGILAANLMRIPALVAFALVPVAGPYALLLIWVFGVLQQLSVTLYDICYLIDFSKVKHRDHAGKEIGIMQQVEKIARVLSPLIGGVIASVWSPEATIIIAAILLVVSALPLLRTVEPTATRIKLQIRGFPWRLAIPSLVAETVVGMDALTSSFVWTMFVTIVVFASFGDAVYAALGGLASLGVFASMIAAWTFGRMIDRHKGDVLLVAGVVANAVIHLFRPFVTAPSGVVAVNIANETATSAYVMPFTRVIFDVADTSGFRIVYTMFLEMALNAGIVLGCVVVVICSLLWGDKAGLIATFIFAAAYEFLMLLSARAAR